MGPRKYPQEPLVRLRRGRADASIRDLASGIRAREEAQGKRSAAEAARARRTEEIGRLNLAESGALARGELTAADLGRQGAWQARAQWEDRDAAVAIAELAAREAVTREAEAQARASVAQSEADAKVVAEHQRRWNDAAQRADDARDEEEATEAWRPPAPGR